MTTVTPFLMFEGRAEEAINLYTSVIPNSKILNITRYGPEGPGKEGSVHTAKFIVANQTIMAIDSFIHHNFSFTSASSLFVDCSSDDEFLSIFSSLSDGGKILMPVDNYGFSKKFGWTEDKFGVSWQINLP